MKKFKSIALVTLLLTGTSMAVLASEVGDQPPGLRMGPGYGAINPLTPLEVAQLLTGGEAKMDEISALAGWGPSMSAAYPRELANFKALLWGDLVSTKGGLMYENPKRAFEKAFAEPLRKVPQGQKNKIRGVFNQILHDKKLFPTVLEAVNARYRAELASGGEGAAGAGPAAATTVSDETPYHSDPAVVNDADRWVGLDDYMLNKW